MEAIGKVAPEPQSRELSFSRHDTTKIVLGAGCCGESQEPNVNHKNRASLRICLEHPLREQPNEHNQAGVRNHGTRCYGAFMRD